VEKSDLSRCLSIISCVSGIMTSLPWLCCFGVGLEQISGNNRAAPLPPKNIYHGKRGQK